MTKCKHLRRRILCTMKLTPDIENVTSIKMTVEKSFKTDVDLINLLGIKFRLLER